MPYYGYGFNLPQPAKAQGWINLVKNQLSADNLDSTLKIKNQTALSKLPLQLLATRGVAVTLNLPNYLHFYFQYIIFIFLFPMACQIGPAQLQTVALLAISRVPNRLLAAPLPGSRKFLSTPHEPSPALQMRAEECVPLPCTATTSLADPWIGR